MDLVVGLGEIGSNLTALLKESKRSVCGFDKNQKLSFGEPRDIDLMHICIPYSKSFTRTVLKYHQKWKPKGTVIHSTVKPGTTKTIHEKLPKGNVVYSPMRGVHTRMHQDIKRYTKFYAFYPETDEKIFEECFRDDCHLKIEKYSTPLALELAKILVDTSYYGWIIAYGQLVDKVCKNYSLDYDELWEFATEIHAFLGNRPKTYVDPKGIGGHCVLSNLDLIEDVLPELKETIFRINEETKRRYGSL